MSYLHLGIEKFYVDDGCHSENDDVVGSYEPKSFRAGVRCCGEQYRHYPFAYHTVCITAIDCDSVEMSYDDAVLHCHALGRRLCTKTELLSGICCRTGGSCDNHAVWTSTSGGTSSGIFFYPYVLSILRFSTSVYIYWNNYIINYKTIFLLFDS